MTKDKSIDPSLIESTKFQYEMMLSTEQLINEIVISDIFKFPITFIQKKFILSLIRDEKNIRLTIVIDVTDGYTTAIIKIPVFENVEIFLIHYSVIELNASLRTW